MNYRYDKIGNLKKDIAEGIDTIRWTVYGKINKIVKSAANTNISYDYDAAGNRTVKEVAAHDTLTKTFYVRDASGNVMAVYKKEAGNLKWEEQHLYGSSRLGMLRIDSLIPANPPNAGETGVYDELLYGTRNYELTNHLGNVLATISDKKIGHPINDTTVDYFNADVVNANDYYPGGMQQPGRTYQSGSGSYRYGFNGKENDSKDGLVQYDYGFRIYDPRLVRFKSVDPLQKRFAELTPFQFASNSTIASVDLDGRESQYYTTTITFINYHQCTSNSDLITGSKQEINSSIPLKTGLFPNGALGSGTMYSIQTQVVDVYKAANGDIEEVKRSQPIITKQFYKLSEEDEMKRDINKRPMFQGKYQLMVFGSGSDNSESPGERPNPNAITETIDMKAWDDIMEPILTGMGKSPMEYEPPSLEEIINSQTQRLIKKAENAENKKLNESDPNTTHCETCGGNFLKKDGKVTFDTSTKKAGDTTSNHGAEPDRKTKKKNE